MAKMWPSYWPCSIYIYIYIYVYICIYVYAVESKLGPKIAFSWVKTWSNFSLFSFFFKNPLLSAGRMRFLRKRAKKREKKKKLFLRQNLVQFCCTTYLDQVLTQPWTKFWLNNFADFWLFLPVWKDAETTIFIVFSAKMKFFKPTPKNKEHYLWTQLR